ncbi:MAG: HAMP domain-containing sensor histidine kinase [Desulfobacterales bacterium]|nr:HAMP domain-containing sensor histidine kinase [Desulfobacterales bacterium]
MYRSKWFFHPILILMLSVAALAMSLFLYIYWYIEISAGLKKLVLELNLDPEQVLESQTWVVIMILSILVGIIFMGIFTIFVYHHKALELYRTQRNFINNFTHELKSPVTSLKLYLETFEKHELSRGDQLKYISYMIQDVSRLFDNISLILNLSGIESKSYGGKFVMLDLVQIIEQFCKNNVHLFRGCEVKIHNPLDRPFLYRINSSLFEMLLMNLITNAIKYNRSKQSTVDISFAINKSKLNIRFEDNGIGIEKRELKKIFKKFYRVDRSDNISPRGSGLGLYLVQNIAHIHKGKVIAESKGIGKGSAFTLIFPC